MEVNYFQKVYLRKHLNPLTENLGFLVDYFTALFYKPRGKETS
jgi:hypothetical protein